MRVADLPLLETSLIQAIWRPDWCLSSFRPSAGGTRRTEVPLAWHVFSVPQRRQGMVNGRKFSES